MQDYKYEAEFDAEMQEQHHYMHETMIAELENETLEIYAWDGIFQDAVKKVKEYKDNLKLTCENLGLVSEEKPLELKTGLKIAYTKPKELTEKDYDAKIEKLKLETLEWEKKKQEFLEDGCVDKKSEPRLSIMTTTKTFKANVAIKQKELLEKHPLFAEMKNIVKQIEN